MQFEPLSDDYVLRLASSDEETARHFVRHFGAFMLMKLRARFLEPSVIDEIRQETFMRVLIALRKEGGIRDGRKLGAFVNTTCNHVLSEYFRQGSRYAVFDGEPIDLPCPVQDAENHLLTQERQEKVREVLNRLPARDRKILTALFLDEKDKDVVCREFSVDRSYLRVLLHRAKISFRQRLNVKEH